ncbi:antibiotic biosynthesis monooxygenase [Herbidospora sp. RD11066]
MPDTILIAESATPWEPAPWPEGLLEFRVYATDDVHLAYTRWSVPDPVYLRGLTGSEPVAFHPYRSARRDDPPEAGCLVLVDVRFDGPDPARLRRWIDAVFTALEAETEPHPGGISADFLVSADGTRVLNFAEWTSAEAHENAVAGGNGIGRNPEWRHVHDFPGVTGSGFRRFRTPVG